MIIKGCIKYLFIGQVLPEKNNVYEKNLLCEIYKQIGDSLTVLSINKTIRDKNTTNKLEKMTIDILPTKRKLIIDDFYRIYKTISYVKKWCIDNKNYQKKIIILNTPTDIEIGLLYLKNRFNLTVVNLIIDTALGNFEKKGFRNLYFYYFYMIGESLAKNMSGALALSSDVFSYLNLDKNPCMLTKIGHNEKENFLTLSEKKHIRKRIVYTGTLISYDGIQELLDAVTLLPEDKYELHIYGTGPLLDLVKEYQSKYKNIVYCGYLKNKEIKRVLSQADILLNIRISNSYTDIFGFPSKLIEYILSGTPIVSTNFKTLPEEISKFLYIVKDETPESIANEILKLEKFDSNFINENSKLAYDYIFNNYNYENIVKEMIMFINKI